MGSCLIVPVGITLDTVKSILKINDFGRINCFLGVSVEGIQDVKEKIFEYLRSASLVFDASFYRIVIRFNDPISVESIYRVLVREKPSLVVFPLLTGSRYLYPVLTEVLLYYAENYNAGVYYIHGIEGGSWDIVPLAGFYSIKLDRRQKEVFFQIYQYDNDEVKVMEDLISKYGYGRSIYKVLRALEKKGLIMRRRSYVIKTLPGKILYKIMSLEG